MVHQRKESEDIDPVLNTPPGFSELKQLFFYAFLKVNCSFNQEI
jgi:hypothetical protein